MKTKLFYPAFDPAMVEEHNIPASMRYVGTHVEFPEGLLDGLISNEVALIDFDPETGNLEAGPFVSPPAAGNKMHLVSVGREEFISRPKSIASIQTLCFGMVIRTIRLIEKHQVLGRKLKWGFNGDQLFVVPRAGFGANAFYHRDSHSLQFLVVADQGRPSDGANGEQQGRFTALSPDIVAHETAHAIVDGIAPGLYDAAAPESLALHEAIADVTALIVSLKTGPFVTYVLDRGQGNLDGPLVGSIAEEIGALSVPSGSNKHRAHGLRNLSNTYALPRSDGTMPKEMAAVTSLEPHDLSEVLSGALFSFMMKLFVQRRKQRMVEKSTSSYSASGYAVAVSVGALASIVYRALDYLPPGEISFADFGRAMLAADRVIFPGDDEKELRDLLTEELVRRNIGTPESLSSYRDFVPPDISSQDLNRFAEGGNDWLIYDFVNRFRSLFRIPDNTPFRVHEPLVLNKTMVSSPSVADTEESTARHYRAERHSTVDLGDSDDEEENNRVDLRELLIKVSWKSREEHIINGSPRIYAFTFGTTVSIDLDRKVVLTRLSTNSDGVPEDHDTAAQSRHRKGRRDLLTNWIQEGRIAEGLDYGTSPQLVERNGVFEVRNMAHQLHVTNGVGIEIPGWLDLDES